jgi:hypothetical protein
MRCIQLGLLAHCVSMSAAVAQVPKHPLASVPADVPYYYHLDFEAMDKAKLGADLKQVKSNKVQKLIDSQEKMWCLVPFMELKSQTYFVEPQPSERGIDSQVTINVARKKLDVEAVGKKIERYSRYGKKPVKNAQTWTFESGSNSLVSYDLSTSDRWVIWDRLKARTFPEAGGNGIHAVSLKSQQDALFAFGLDISAVPKEARQVSTLPNELKFAAPFLEAKGVWIDGRIVKDQFVLNVTVEGKSKEHTIEMVKAVKTGKPVIVDLINKSTEYVSNQQVEPKPLLAWIDTLNKSITDAEVTTKDSLLKVVVSIPMKESLAPVMTWFAGGGTASDRVLGENLHNIGFAFHEEHDKSGSICRAFSANEKKEKLLSWRVHLLPFVGEKELYTKFKLDEPWDSAHNKKVFEENPIPVVYAMEGVDRTKEKFTRFQVFTGSNSIFDSAQQPLKIYEFRDGTSNTGLVFLADKAVEWTKPTDLQFDAKGDTHIDKLWFDKSGITLISMADGSVQIVKKKTLKESDLKAAITPNGGEAYRFGDD